MAQGVVGFDASKPAGQKFTQPEVRTEIAGLAPSSPPDGSIGSVKLAPDSVTKEKMAPASVGGAEIEPGGVGTPNIAAKAVTQDKIGDKAVGRLQAGPGVMTFRDTNGNPATVEGVVLSSTQWAQLGANEDPNTVYFIWDA